MGKVFKKTSNKRPAEAVVEKKESPHKKKSKKEEVIDEQIDDEEIDDEEIDDEEIDDEEIDDEEINDEEIDEEEVDDEEEEDDVNDDDKQDETNTILDFNFEGFPMEKDDLEGIVNMLTQTFLRTDIDLKGMAEDMISKSPFGSVVGPADDDADEDNTNMVYGLCSAVSVNRKENPKFVKDILNYLHNKVKKYATKEVAGKLESIFKENDESTAFFVNERMLNFPEIIVPQLFESLRSDIAGLAKPYKNIIYIQKIRILEENEKDKKPTDNNGASSSFKPKKKMGKAEKKRLAAAALSKAEVKFDNPEDKLLFELKEGSEIHFDYPVHMDVEPGSKFHVIEESGKKLNPFRRLVIMDFTRFDAFLKSRGKNVIV